MKPFIYGLILYIFMALPPVIYLTESIMTIHMHMQMPLLAVSGMLMTPLFKQKFPHFFEKWNKDGVPGIILFIIVVSYWFIPRAMDDALMYPTVEIFKFISWPFLVGVPLMDSWLNLSKRIKSVKLIVLTFMYGMLTFIYYFYS